MGAGIIASARVPQFALCERRRGEGAKEGCDDVSRHESG